MSGVTVIYWRDIPTQVVEGQGRSATRVALADRFQQAVDQAATRAGLVGSDEYMSQWHKVTQNGTDPRTVARRLEEDHPPEKLSQLVANEGKKES